jgi:solute carrier family 35 protein
VGLVVMGCLVAGIGDLTFHATAYAYAFGIVLVQALYLLLVEFQVRPCFSVYCVLSC